MQCCLEAALAWNGTHTQRRPRGLPALHSAPRLHLQPGLHLVCLHGPLLPTGRGVSPPVLGGALLCLPSIRCLLPPFLPASSPLSPGPPTFSPGSFPAADYTCSPTPPYVNLALNLPPPQVTPIRLLPCSVEKGLFLLHAACSLLNSRWPYFYLHGGGNAPTEVASDPQGTGLLSSAPQLFSKANLCVSLHCPPAQCWGSMLNSLLLRPLPSHIHTKAPVGSLFLGQGCPQVNASLFIWLLASWELTPAWKFYGQRQSTVHWPSPHFLLPTSLCPLLIS